MRVAHRFLVSITLAALLCTGAAKHANLGAKFAGSTEGLRHAQERRAYRLEKPGDGAAVEGLLRLSSGEAAASPSGSPPVSYLIATYPGGLPTATAATATAYPLLTVNAVAVDPAGNVFLSSTLSCVFKLDSAGNLTRVAGTGKAGYSGDGGPATSAQLDYPKGVALDLAGNLYIADYFNQRVRKVSPNGVITTVAGSGVAGPSGDGGPARSAQLNSPQGDRKS